MVDSTHVCLSLYSRVTMVHPNIGHLDSITFFRVVVLSCFAGAEPSDIDSRHLADTLRTESDRWFWSVKRLIHCQHIQHGSQDTPGSRMRK